MVEIDNNGFGDDYIANMHAVQSGVMQEQAMDQQERGANWHNDNHKHLRVGINSAMINDAALVRLLVDKGILSWEEYGQEVTAESKREVERYEERLSKKLGCKITLG